MERQTGSARLTGSPGGQGDDELLRAVKEAAAAEYEILGEMGRGERGSVVYLSRERASQKLVALKLRPDGGEFELSVVRELDASVPAMGNKCPSCKVDLVGWGRFCSNCGKDLSGTRSGEASPEELLKAVKGAAEGEYEVLGEMERSEGGGVVYFAREIKSQRLVALRLTREQESDGSESYALAACITEVGDAYVAPSDATRGLITCVTPSAYDSLPSLSCSRVSGSAQSRWLFISRAKYTTPPPSERSISPSTSYSPSAAPCTAFSSSSRDVSPDRVPDRSLPQWLQNRPQPTRSTLQDGHLLPIAGTVAS